MANTNDPKHFLNVATRHYSKLQEASDDIEPDWECIGTYGLYCLEALVRAAALKSGETPVKTHWGKEDQARNLSTKHGLPDITNSLRDLNTIRKSLAYGDSEFEESDYDFEDVMEKIKEYYLVVSEFVVK